MSGSEAAIPDRELLLDGATIVVISAAICMASDQVVAMTLLVPAVIAARTVVWVGMHGRGAWRGEVVFLAICTVLGGFNDWNTVVHHGVYAYTVPHFFPQLSSIPLWMLLYWGMILRFMFTLSRWRGLEPPVAPRDTVRLGRRRVHSAGVKVGLVLALVLVTRQCIYRTYDDPVLSWLPFLLAGALYLVLFPPARAELRLAALTLVLGPAVEVLYIQVGGLHQYALGWIGGVPVWIAVWWVVAVWVWGDLGWRIHRAVAASPAEVVVPRSATA
ncbi:MAG: hypothetical protein JRI25_02550 [Deltaproteobacteria bacterium]|nr:hypothetical protein [Deltaproteobacteria bacterium]